MAKGESRIPGNACVVTKNRRHRHELHRTKDPTVAGPRQAEAAAQPPSEGKGGLKK
jgi:hypothetical protein